MNEAAYYNYFNRELKADYRALGILKKAYSTWEHAFLSTAARQKMTPEDAQKEFANLYSKNTSLVLAGESAYPTLLSEIHSAPHALYIRGTLPANNANTLAIVGTRKATEEGIEAAERFAYILAGHGFVIVSGLALGIDAAAHRGALRAGGKTIAVLGNGVESTYPRTNARLGEEICATGGAIVSEYPLGTPPLPHHFLARNRIVSGLSHGTLVIEAPERSGALVTARFALDQNRDVFVLPGFFSHPQYAGSHELIRAGAELVTNPDHIVLSLTGTQEKENPRYPMGTDEACVFSALQNATSPLGIDKISEVTNLKAKTINTHLTMLLIKNLIEESDKGFSAKSL